MSLVSSANQHTSDVREQKMWDFYVKGITNSTENAYQAAIDAGYSEDHARNITLQGWFKERKDKLRRREMLSKAERNLDNILDIKYRDDEGKVISDVLRIVTDVSKSVTSTLGKDQGYSSRQEITGKDGKDITTGLTEEQKAKLDNLLT